MTHSWKEYQNALNVVETWKREQEAIRKERTNTKPFRTYNDIIWKKREELNREQYLLKTFTPENIARVGEIQMTIIADLRTVLMKCIRNKYKSTNK